jgi:predicted ferric reductase
VQFRPPKPTAAAFVLLLIGLGACGAIGLWWQDTLPFGPGWGNELSNAGRVLGLLAGYLVAVQLILMARIPWLDHTLGPQRLATWHASIGRYVIIALVSHAAAIILGYAILNEQGVVDQTIKLWTSYAYVWLAMIGLVLFVVIGIVSARAVRHRVSYETWYLIHLLTYVGIGLSFWHALFNGAEFAFSFRNRVFWSALYALAFACILVFRVAIPMAGTLRMRAHIVEVVHETASVVSLHIGGSGLPRVKPGQFVRLRLLDGRSWWHSHPFSVSAPSSDRRLRVTVKAVGSHTCYLRDGAFGTRVLVSGPYGALTVDRKRRQRTVLIAGGIGVTPLLPLLETLPGSSGDITLVYRASSADDLAFKAEIERAATAREAHVIYVLGPRGAEASDDPIRAEELGRLIPGIDECDVYLCGPEGLIDQVRGSLRSLGVPSQSIHVEQFAF